jgi:4-amino-4-deoxy-L-arabinose transferase-like glycosyltransferase
MNIEGSKRGRRDQLIVVVLLAVALVWRVVYFVEMEASPYGGNLGLDSLAYHDIAVQAASGVPIDGTYYQAPLYPWTLGIVYKLFGTGQTAAKLLQILLSVASCWLIFRIAERVFDRKVALVSLGLAAVYGTSIFFANELLAVTLVVFLDLVGLDLLLRAADSKRKWPWPAAGLAFGLSAIARPTILPFVAVVVLWVLVLAWRTRALRPAVVSLALFAAGVAAPIIPVTLHNWLADGEPVLVASNGGFNFYIGNNPASDGITAAAPGVRPDYGGAHADNQRIAREALGRIDATPKEVSDYWYGKAWQHIGNDPWWAVRHTAYKAFVFFNASEVSNTRVIGFVTRHSSLYSWATIGFWLILPLAVAGVVLGGGDRRSRAILLLFCGVSAATVVPFFVNARFRMPVVGVMIVFAAAAVVALAAVVRERRVPRRAAIAVVAALVTAVMIRPLPAVRTSSAQAFFNEAEAHRSHEDYANAADWYQAALDEYPGYCDAAYNLARIHIEIYPDLERVIEVLEPVAESCATDLEIQTLLQRALCAVGRCGETGLTNGGETASTTH